MRTSLELLTSGQSLCLMPYQIGAPIVSAVISRWMGVNGAAAKEIQARLFSSLELLLIEDDIPR